MTGFDTCLAVVLREEGGYVDDSHDPGGITNLGITKAVWDAWVHHDSTEAEMRALTPAAVAPLYRVQYWLPVAGDSLPIAIALCVFDFAINAGVSRSARTLQQVVGAAADGHIGPATLKALQALAVAKGLAEVVRQFKAAKIAHYRSLPTFSRFGKGWLARCDRIETAALKMGVA